MLHILALGDVIGKPGRQALKKLLPDLVAEHDLDFVMVNGENASGGLGLTQDGARGMLAMPIQVITSGNHIWRYKEMHALLDEDLPVLRPANYPEGTPGRGSGVFKARDGTPVGVLNLEGTLFMSPLPCPFRTADQEIKRLRTQTPIVLVDFHAEATSEKRALGHYLDGRISALVGTHTHVPTADAEVLPQGSGYLTDLGMCGPLDSVIGMRKEPAIARFTTRLPHSVQVAQHRVQLQGALIQVDPASGRCLKIQQRAWPIDN